MPIRHASKFATEFLVSPKHQKYEPPEACNRDHAPELNNSRHYEGVPINLRVIVVAVGQNIGYRRPNLVIRGVDQAQEHILWRVLHPKVVLRNTALRGCNLEGARMRKL